MPDLLVSPQRAVSPCVSGPQENTPTVCLLGATFGTPNLGVNALTVGAVKAVLQRWPGARLFVLDYGRESSTYCVDVDRQRVEVPLVNLRFSKDLYLSNHVLVILLLAALSRMWPTRRFRAWLCAHNPWFATIDSADVAASVAGGDSFSDIYGLIALFYIVLPQLICLTMTKRLVLLPQTYGPFHGSIARATARYILRRAERIYSRDFVGVQTARELLRDGSPSGSVRFCHDLGLLLTPRPVYDEGIERLLAHATPGLIIGLNVSGLLSRTGNNFASLRGFASDYDELIERVVEFLIDQRGASVLLVPHVFGRGGQSDVVVCEKLYSRLSSRFGRQLAMVKDAHDHHTIKYIIGQCDFFIGSRMHACIGAVSQCIPAVSLAYSDKFAGVMQTMGMSDLVADLRTMTTPNVVSMIGGALDHAGQYRELLRRQMPGWRESVLNVFADCESDVVVKP